MNNKYFFVDWFDANGRDFPWRINNVTPFKILITEMLLKQTQASSVARIWNALFDIYPTSESMGNANMDELKLIIQSLGFGNQRKKALIGASRYIVENYNGEVPVDLEKLLSIPYIGWYSAKAVLSFAYSLPYEIVDSNVLRFYARFYEIIIKPDIRQNIHIWELAKDHLPLTGHEVKKHNYGLLDFTAQICTAIKPKCLICPLNTECIYSLKDVQEKI